MATSESYNYNLTANGIITEALSLIGVYDPGETLSSDDTTTSLTTLNMMLKSWQAQGIGLWTRKEYSLFLQDETYSYDIGQSGDHCSVSSVKTELASAAASGASSVTIDATTDFGDTYDRDGILTATTAAGATAFTLDGATVTSGVAYLPSGSGSKLSARKILIYAANNESAKTFAVVGTDNTDASQSETITGPNATTVYSTYEYKTITSVTPSGATTGDIEIGVVGDPVGIELDGGTVQWTNIGAALSTTLTLITTLTGAAAVDNHVYSYTAKAQRPLDIYNVRLVKSDGSETPLGDPISRAEYMALSNKDLAGSPNQVYFDPQRVNAVIKTWPACNDVQEYIKFTGKHPVQDLDATGNDIDVPVEWYEAIAWSLAVRLAPKYGKKLDPEMIRAAGAFKQESKDFDREYSPVQIQVY